MENQPRSLGIRRAIAMLAVVVAGTTTAACTPRADGGPSIGNGFVMEKAGIEANRGSYTVLIANTFVNTFPIIRADIQHFIDEYNAFNNNVAPPAASRVELGFVAHGTIPAPGQIVFDTADSPSDCTAVNGADPSTVVGCTTVSTKLVGGGSSAYTEYESATVKLTSNIHVNDPGELQATIGHELGHAFGLGHYDYAFHGTNQLMQSAVEFMFVNPTDYQDGDKLGLQWAYDHGSRQPAP
jgi:hypothetical protein